MYWCLRVESWSLDTAHSFRGEADHCPGAHHIRKANPSAPQHQFGLAGVLCGGVAPLPPRQGGNYPLLIKDPFGGAVIINLPW